MKIIKSCGISEIQTDHVIEARRADSFEVDKKERSCKIINFQFLKIGSRRRGKVR